MKIYKIAFPNKQTKKQTKDPFGLNYDTLVNSLQDTLAEEESEMDLNQTMKKIISHLQKIQKRPSITLYRLIFVKSQEEINKNNLGLHYVEKVEDFHEHMIDWLFQNAREKNPQLTEDDAFLVTVTTPTINIDYQNTLITNSNHPYEEEIMLLSSQNINIVKIQTFWQ